MGTISRFNDHENLGFSYLKMNGFDTYEAKVGRLPLVLSMLVFFPEQRCG
jgi:hypothetical protein